MKKNKAEENSETSQQHYSAALEPPPAVRKWFRVSLILNFIAASIFIAAFLRNYFASNLFDKDSTLPFFLFLSPVLIRATYFTAKNYLIANKEKIPFSDTIFFYDYDTFLISVIKFNLLLALIRLVIEIIGFREWSSLLEYFSPPVRQIINLYFGV